MQLIDTHTHLVDACFADDLDAVLGRAQAAGIAAILVVAETLEESRRVLALRARYPALLRAAIGLFPTHLDLEEADAICALARANASALTAIGEVGLDYWKVKDEAGRATQRAILGKFVDLANELELPLNVHSRSAGRHTIAFLLERGAERVQMHAYDGKASSAAPAVEAGWSFSVPPSIVRSPQKQKLVKRVPIEHLLLETDSPVLGPERDARNEPANVCVSLRAIAEIKGLDTAEAAAQLTANTVRLYPRILGAPAA